VNHIVLFYITGYVQVFLQIAIVLSVANVQWTVKRLSLATAVIFLPHTIVINAFFHGHILSWENMTIWVLLTIFIYLLFFKQSWKRSVFMVAGQYFLVAGFDYLFFFIINHMPDDIRFFILENLFVLRISVIIMYLLMFIYMKKFSDIEYSSLNHLITKYWSFYLMFFLLFVAYDIIHMIELDRVQHVDNLTEAFAVALFLIFFIHSLWHVRKDHWLETTQRELEYQKLHVESHKNTLDELQRFKHSSRTTFRTINKLIEIGDIPELKIYMKEVEKSAQMQPPQVIEIPDIVADTPIIEAMLLETYELAEMKGIKFTLNADEKNIDLKYCSGFHYSHIFSNLMDNALEAAERSEEKTVNCIIRTENGKLVTIITNSCDEAVDIDRIFDPGFSTKTPPSGRGLPLIRLIQEEYEKKGHSIQIITTYENGCFTQIFKV